LFQRVEEDDILVSLPLLKLRMEAGQGAAARLMARASSALSCGSGRDTSGAISPFSGHTYTPGAFRGLYNVDLAVLASEEWATLRRRLDGGHSVDSASEFAMRNVYVFAIDVEALILVAKVATLALFAFLWICRRALR